jgi:hypothetical protein
MAWVTAKKSGTQIAQMNDVQPQRHVRRLLQLHEHRLSKFFRAAAVHLRQSLLPFR